MDINDYYNLENLEKSTQALHHAIEEGNTVLTLQLLPVSNPRLWHSQALWTAALYNNLVMVDALIPFSDPSDPTCKAIEVAAQEGYEQIVRRLIPAVLDVDILNKAFANALSYDHPACQDVLFEVCEPEKVLNMLLSSLHNPHGREQVEQRFAELKKRRIVQHLDTQRSSPRKERKM